MTKPYGREPTTPRLELRDPAPHQVAVVRAIQRALLTHPVACQAAFTALVAEGRRFGETAEGGEWRSRLMRSALLQRLRLVFDVSTLGLIEEGNGRLPSSYLDALFMIAAGGDADGLLNRVFWDRDAEEHRGDAGH
jgi:hypothetical protein